MACVRIADWMKDADTAVSKILNGSLRSLDSYLNRPRLSPEMNQKPHRDQTEIEDMPHA